MVVRTEEKKDSLPQQFRKNRLELIYYDIIFAYFVRYYNSWIETSDEFAQSDTSSSFSSTPKTSESEKKVSLPQQFRKNSLDLTDDIEKFAPQVAEASADFSISYEVGISITRIFLCGLRGRNSAPFPIEFR